MPERACAGCVESARPHAPWCARYEHAGDVATTLEAIAFELEKIQAAVKRIAARVGGKVGGN